jgi:hypothetical protein
MVYASTDAEASGYHPFLENRKRKIIAKLGPLELWYACILLPNIRLFFAKLI